MKKIIWFFICFFIFFIYDCNAQNSQDIKFFETKIRPVLVEKCYKCHSTKSKKIKGGLKLDTKDGTLKGGNTGPAIVPKDLNKSLLVKSIRYTDEDLSMPPKEKLPDNIIKDFETWVKMGAYDPRTSTSTITASEAAAKKHWAYEPLVKPSVPNTKSKWINNEIDSFIFLTAKSKNILPSIEADRKTLLRRVYYTLTGLPPTIEEVNEFVNDKSSNAYEKVVNRLLSTRAFGEKWARYWFDTSRYSDTTGSVNRNRENRYTYSWTYRNYVIDAFQNDKPFNQFIIEQIAADKIPNLPKQDLAALGFLTLGKNSGNANDVIDDRIDVITKGFMATTVVCARCHDHKFDPVSTKDYYALHGILNSSYEPTDKDKPLLLTITETPEYKNYFAKKLALEQNVENFKIKKYSEAFQDFQTNTYKWMYSSYALQDVVNSNKQAYIRTNSLNPRMMQRWDRARKFTVNKKVNNKNTKVSHPVFLPYSKMYNVKKDFSAVYKKMLEANKDNINPYLYSKIKTSRVRSMYDLAVIYQQVIIEAQKRNFKFQGKKDKAPEGLIDFCNAIYSNNGPMDMNKDNFQRYYSDNGKTMRYDREVRREIAKLVTHELTDPATPPRAMAMYDKKRPSNSSVMINGDPRKRGVVVQRRFIEFFNNVNSNIFTNGSGRLELAMAIANPKNPLTPRVAVSRIWQRIMGNSFVATPDDFGMNTPRPVHSNLINWMAAEFIEKGWSQKHIIKKLVMSATYRQSSLISPKYYNIDPDNEYYHRANLQRLDFEGLRDTILSVSGILEEGKFKQHIDLFAKGNNRRTIYGTIDRSRFPELLLTFDFATPEMTTGKRFETTVPKQALYLMNSDDMKNYCEAVFNDYRVARSIDFETRVTTLFNMFYQRDPNSQDMIIAKRFFEAEEIDPTNMSEKEEKEFNKWKQYIQLLFMSNELIYVN